jgi:predicted DNA repair protein MutK
VAPWAITPLLMLGGLFLCFEGAEKLMHKFFHPKEAVEAHRAELVQAVADEKVDLVAFEKDKIKGAVRTDFILSAEIIVITLGAVASAPFLQQVSVLVGISLIMTIGVYGLVGGIVKIDDAGLHLSRSTSSAAQAFGQGLLVFAPWLMKTLSVLGTAAMFLVGGGILLHGVPALGHAVEHWAEGLGAASGLINSLAGGLAGVVAGALAVVVFNAVNKLRGKTAH